MFLLFFTIFVVYSFMGCVVALIVGMVLLLYMLTQGYIFTQKRLTKSGMAEYMYTLYYRL